MTDEPPARERPRPVPRYARVDVVGGAVIVLVAALIGYGAIGLRLGELNNFGPGAMPTGLAVILFVGGAAVLANGLLQPGDEAEAVSFVLRPPLILAIAIVFFGLFIRGGQFWFFATPRLGLMVVGPLCVFIAGFATTEADPRELVVLALGLTAGSLLVFADLLGVPIPVFPEALEKAVPPAFGVGAAVRVLYAAYGVLTAGLYVVFFGMPRARNG